MLRTTDEEQEHQAGDRFASAVRAIRLDQKGIAAKLRVTPGFLSHVKTHRRRLTADVALRVEEVFGFNHRWLLRGEAPVIADEDKAARYVEFASKDSLADGTRADLTLRDRHGQLVVFEAKGERRNPGRAPRVPAERFVPVLWDFGDGVPVGSWHFKNTFVRLAIPAAEELYAIRAGTQLQPTFRPGEILVLERRPPGEWRPEDVDGAVCMAKSKADAMWRLHYVNLTSKGNDPTLELAAVSGQAGDTEVYSWDEVEILGVVVLVFWVPPEGKAFPA